jgi:predicted amidohydrolase YtcJ
VESTGVQLYSDDELYRTLTAAFQADVQVMAHCIGDASLDQFLNVLEKAKSNGIRSRWPVKLTHVELCHKEEIQRMAPLGCACDVQPHMIITDSPFLEGILGLDRRALCFPFRTMIETGLIVTGSSDAPVEPIDPRTGIWAAVVRTPQMNPSEALSLDDALKLYTVNPQRLVRNEAEKGLIKPGYVADVVVFQQNLFEVPPNDLKSCEVAHTIVDGRVAYSRP